MVKHMLKVEVASSFVDKGAPLTACNENLVLKVIAEKFENVDDGGKKAFMDLVLVVDISGSMGWEGKLDEVKRVLRGILTGKWQSGGNDRPQPPWVRVGDYISIVTFSDDAHVPLDMEMYDPKNVGKVEKIIQQLQAGGNTHMQKGLEKAKEVIGKFKKNGTSDYHTTAIILLSDGMENNNSNARSVDLRDVLVDTIGFGSQHDRHVLNYITDKSAGGAYNNATEHTATLATTLSAQLEYVKHIIAKDVTLIADPPRVVPLPATPSSVSYLPDQKTHRFHVSLRLGPAVEGAIDKVTFNLSYKPMIGPLLGLAVPLRKVVDIKRTTKAPAAAAPRMRSLPGAEDDVPMPKAVLTEEIRLDHFEMIKNVSSLAESGKFKEAKAKIAEGMATLGKLLSRLTNDQVSRQTLTHMYFEAEGLVNAVDTYNTRGGHSYVAACISSHHRQRYVSRGDAACQVRLFATERMNKYLDEALELDFDA